MRYSQYKGVVEREFDMPLKKLMHETCVVEGLTTAAGARKLGVVKEIFMYWRSYYRFEKKQVLFDEAIKELKNINHIGSSVNVERFLERKKA